MFIIKRNPESKYHDFYEFNKPDMIDKSCIYDRKVESFDGKENNPIVNWFKQKNNFPFFPQNKESFRILLFCGKLYAIADFPVPETICEKKSYFNLEILTLPKKVKPWENNVKKSEIDNLLEINKAQEQKLIEIHRLAKSPIIIVKGFSTYWFHNNKNKVHKIYLNPILSAKEYGMAQGLERIIPPFQAWQMLSMFLTNEMATQKDPIVKLSDKDNIERHGMDPIKSFRKMPR